MTPPALLFVEMDALEDDAVEFAMTQPVGHFVTPDAAEGDDMELIIMQPTVGNDHTPSSPPGLEGRRHVTVTALPRSLELESRKMTPWRRSRPAYQKPASRELKNIMFAKLGCRRATQAGITPLNPVLPMAATCGGSIGVQPSHICNFNFFVRASSSSGVSVRAETE